MKAISGVVDEIRKERGVEAIYLFGSRASGRQKPYSDIDLCVITGRSANREKILRNSSEKIDTSIFWDLPLNIRLRVLRDGRPLYIKNKLKMHRISVSTVMQYLDFKPMLERHFSKALGG
jgi:predicted nucleotidyltransferase